MGKDVCIQAWCPEFGAQVPHSKTELIPTGCPMVCGYVPWHTSHNLKRKIVTIPEYNAQELEGLEEGGK